jgi:hypothetical protein
VAGETPQTNPLYAEILVRLKEGPLSKGKKIKIPEKVRVRVRFRVRIRVRIRVRVRVRVSVRFRVRFSKIKRGSPK